MKIPCAAEGTHCHLVPCSETDSLRCFFPASGPLDLLTGSLPWKLTPPPTCSDVTSVDSFLCPWESDKFGLALTGCAPCTFHLSLWDSQSPVWIMGIITTRRWESGQRECVQKPSTMLAHGWWSVKNVFFFLSSLVLMESNFT